MLNEENTGPLIKALNDIYPVSRESIRQLLEITRPEDLKRNQHLLPFQKTCKHIYFIDQGFLRIYYLKEDKEITEWFADQGEFCFSINSYFKQKPSKLAIEALEESRVLKISKEGLDRLKKTNLEIANLLLEMYSGSLVLSQDRMNSIQFETARERYEQLEQQHPNIILKAPLQDIASFLGITSETLSRIRSNRN